MWWGRGRHRDGLGDGAGEAGAVLAVLFLFP